MLMILFGGFSSLYGIFILILSCLMPGSFEGGEDGTYYRMYQLLFGIAGFLLIALGYAVRD